MGSLEEGESALRFDDGLFFASLQDDYCFPVPSHPPEFERLERCHIVYKHLIGNLPQQVSDYLNSDDDIAPKYILDVGSGTGKWACEVAEEYPHVGVTGIDLVHCPIPDPPSNASFEVRDILYGLEYGNETLDVVHIQDIGLGIRDYPALIVECTRVLKRGGYLILLELEYHVDYLSSDESPEHRCPEMWGSFSLRPTEGRQAFQASLKERGLDPFIGYNLENHLAYIPGLEQGEYERHCVPVTPRHSDPMLSYLGQVSTEIWEWFGQSSRLLLQDHGPYDSERLASESMEELEEEEMFWFFDTAVIRKA